MVLDVRHSRKLFGPFPIARVSKARRWLCVRLPKIFVASTITLSMPALAVKLDARSTVLAA
jgi:hypothetical protein